MFEQRVAEVIDRVDRMRDQVDDHWQIPHDEAKVLATLVRACRSRSILEIGTSYGFSTLHLAAATQPADGHVHTIDVSEKKYHAARDHLTQAGLSSVVTQHLGDARQVIASIEPREPFDFVFIDAVKEQSHDYLYAILPRLAAHALLATDNTITHEAQLASFVQTLRSDARFVSCGIPVGNGFELSVFARP